MPRPLAPIAFAGASLGDHRHVCAFFSSRDDEYRVMMPFIRDGLLQGDRAIHYVSGRSDDHEGRLRGGGIDVDAARRHGQLQILRSEEMYMPDGVFDISRMLESVQHVLDEAPQLGYRMTRLWAHAEFVTAGSSSAHDFIEYEARLNYVLPRYSDPVICVYDLEKTSMGVAFDVLRTHPVVIIGDVLMENPYFVPPDLFLSELAARHTGGRSPTAQVT
jgi:hypothetical protein